MTPEAEHQSEVEYRDAVGFPGYRIGNDGTVWSRRRGAWRKLHPDTLQKIPYQRVTVFRAGEPERRTIHTLVLEAFVGPRPAGMWARHLDGNARNNKPANLKWDTPSENLRDRKRHGRSNYGEKNSQAKLTAAKVIELRRRRKAGEKLTVLAQAFGVNFRTVSQVARGKNWGHWG